MYKLKFTTITPLHISNGETLDQNFHYTIYRDEFYRIDHNKLARLLAKKEKIDFTKEINITVIENWVRKYQLEIVDNASSYTVNIDDNFKSHLSNPRAQGRRQVIEFINSNGKFYIPASSIKGALLTVLGLDTSGIQAGPKANIKDKIVFHDSDFIDYKNFKVYRTENRPPANNLICLIPGTDFEMKLQKNGNLSIEELKSKLSHYSSNQVELALDKIVKFKSRTDQLKGADHFEKALEEIERIKSRNNEFLINLGYGGGSWFKVFENTIPKFKSKSPNPQRKGKFEEAHTTFSVSIKNKLYHLGWCKLEIKELWKLSNYN